MNRLTLAVLISVALTYLPFWLNVPITSAILYKIPALQAVEESTGFDAEELWNRTQEWVEHMLTLTKEYLSKNNRSQ